MGSIDCLAFVASHEYEAICKYPTIMSSNDDKRVELHRSLNMVWRAAIKEINDSATRFLGGSTNPELVEIANFRKKVCYKQLNSRVADAALVFNRIPLSWNNKEEIEATRNLVDRTLSGFKDILLVDVSTW